MKRKNSGERFPSPIVAGDGAIAEALRRFSQQPGHVPPEAVAWERTLARLGRERGRHRGRTGLAVAIGAMGGAVALYVAMLPRPHLDAISRTAVARVVPASGLAPSVSAERVAVGAPRPSTAPAPGTTPPMPLPVPAPTSPLIQPATSDAPRIQLGRAAVGLPVGRADLLGEAEVTLSRFGGARAYTAPGATTVELVTGHLDLVVEKRHAESGRVFEVLAGPYRFTVLGTIFRVSRVNEDVTLSVTEGRVAVSRGRTSLAVVTGGGVWSSTTDADSPSAPVGSELPSQDPSKPNLPVPASPALEPPAAKGGLESPPSGRPADNRCAEKATADPRAAVACFLEAGQGSDLGSEIALYEAARLYRDALDDPARAIATLRGALQRFPAGALQTEVELSLVELLPKVGKYREALGETEKILATNPGGERANELHLLRGDVLRTGLGDFAAAEAEYAAAARADGERVSDAASFWRAVCLERLNRTAEAVHAFEEYLARPRAIRSGEAAHHLEALGRGRR